MNIMEEFFECISKSIDDVSFNSDLIDDEEMYDVVLSNNYEENYREN